MTLANLLVTTDFSPAARKAYDCAVNLAAKFGAVLHLAHLEDLSAFPFSELPAASYTGELDAAVREEAKNETFKGTRVVPHSLRSRQPFAALKELTREENIDLVVTATHGRTGLDRFLLGSFAERLVRTSIVPVLVCRQPEGRASTAPAAVLVPIDFSEQSSGVFPAVRFLAANYRCRFIFLHVQEPIPSYAPFSTRLRGLVGGVAERIGHRFAKLREEELAGIEAALETCEGVPYMEIVRRAREAESDVVLISTRGELGSVAQNVIRSAPCSVLTMRQQQSREGHASAMP